MNVFMCFFCLASAVYITSASEDLCQTVIELEEGCAIPEVIFLPFEQKSVIPPSCPPNEIYRFCISNCSDCIQRSRCKIERCIGGCDCAPHFYRVTPGGPCEPVANCPIQECGDNEVFRECGPICERCTTFNCRVINCDHKCYCKEGYLRNGEVCIPAEECPQKLRCSRTEEWAENGLVEEYCLHEENDTVSNKTQEVAQCYCKEGYRRNSLGYCINETLCSNIQCLGKEKYYNCVPKCNTTCRNYGDPNCTEDGNCYPGCFCPSGYVMNDLRMCIALNECTLDMEHTFLRKSDDEDDEEDDSSVTESNTASVRSESTDIVDETETSCSDENTGTTDATETSSDESTITTDVTETSSVESTSTTNATETSSKDESSEEKCKASTIESSTTSEPNENHPSDKPYSEVEASETKTTKDESVTSSTTPELIVVDDADFDNDNI